MLFTRENVAYLILVTIVTYIFSVIKFNKQSDFGAQYGVSLSIFPLMGITAATFISGLFFLWIILINWIAYVIHLIVLVVLWRKFSHHLLD